MNKKLGALRADYEADEDFAIALLSEATQLIETVLFREGETLRFVMVEPNEGKDGGYHILVKPKE